MNPGDDMGTNRLMFPAAGFAAAMALTAGLGLAATPVDQQKRFESEVRAEGSAFGGFSAQRGEALFKTTHGGEWSCASCHTANPVVPGKHAKTGKPIAPLAPAANAERFTDTAAVDKWFRRNCNDVLGRACNAQEKGDVLQYLMSLK
jgi:mono/diheme cytochrome c family protein